MLSRINKELLPMKAHYFLFNAGTGPVVPFLSTYARQLGFSPTIVGLIYTVLPISGMFAKPIMGSIADRFKCQKLLFLTAQILTAAAFLSINFSPEVPLERTVHFSCDGDAVFDTSPSNNSIDECIIDHFQNDSSLVSCELDCSMEEQFWNVISQYWKVEKYKNVHPKTFQFNALVNKSKTVRFGEVATFLVKNVSVDGQNYAPLCPCGKDCHISTLCGIKCNDYTLNDLVTKSSISDDDVYGLPQFWIFLILMVVGWSGQAIIVSIGDAICFEMLGDKPNRYGYQRLFGALGWGIFSVIAGLMVDALSEDSSKKNYQSAFFMASSFLLLDFLVSSRLDYTQRKISSNICKDVGKLLVDLRIIVFLVCCVAVGMCTGLIWNFFFFLIEDLAREQGCDSQKWTKTLEGLVMGIQTLAGEMPFFFLSGKILKRIGHTNSMTLVLFVIGVRYILYSVIANPWWFLPVELLNGLTFGLFYACMASYASIVAPPGTEATMQGMVGAIFEGVGVSLGSFLGGTLYDSVGGVHTFRYFGIGALVVFLLHGGIQFFLKDSDCEPTYALPHEALNSLDDDQQELTLIGS